MFYDFIIHYYKDSLNPVNDLFRYLNYMNEEHGLNTTIFWLISILENKVKKLITSSFEVHEQFDAKVFKPSAVSLMQALSMQVIT